MPKIRFLSQSPFGISLFLVCISAIFCSCVKSKEFPDIPYLEYRELQFSGKINNSGDTIPILNVKFYFQDGDGDIGSSDVANSQNLYFALYHKISDTVYAPVYALDKEGKAYPVEYAYKLKAIEPINSNGALHGTMTWEMEDFAGIEYEYPEDTVRFNIWLFDRSGNKSNVICTESIALRAHLPQFKSIALCQ